MTIHEICIDLLLFFLYSFLGWCGEVAFAAIKNGRFVNRGFLIGPVCPIYGCGVLLVYFLLRPLLDNTLVLFLGSTVLTSALEFLVGLLAERIFHQRLWDYSRMPLNLKGYICLPFSLVWGVACVLIFRFLHPAFLHLAGLLPFPLVVVGDILFSALLITDLTLTLIHALKLPRRLQAMEELGQALQNLSDGIGSGVSETAQQAKARGDALLTHLKEDERLQQHREELQQRADALRARYEALTAQRNIIHTRLLRAFPHLQEGRYQRSAKQLIATWRQQNEAKKKNRQKGTPGHHAGGSTPGTGK